MEIDPEFKAKWVAALRSGKWAQCRGRLYDGKGYCCLGVAEKLLSANRKISQDSMPALSDKLIDLLSARQRIELIARNDNAKQSFAQIADYIEANL